MFEKILKEFGINASALVKPFGSGLINNTWLISNEGADFILQRINQNVFKNPVDIAANIHLICDHFKTSHPGYLFPCPRKTVSGDEMLFINDEGYFRIFPFIKNSHTTDVVNSSSQANEAAKQFGRFTNLLSGFSVNQLKITIPDFHNLSLRYSQFESAIRQGNKARIKEAAATINFLKEQHEIASISEQISKDPGFKKRVTHHDSKISNVLFDENDKGLCVIDLDTVMPGYFISDFGDMMRTYLSPVSEEENDLSRIAIRDDIYESIIRGYHGEMKNELTDTEVQHYFFAGSFMIFMQVIRFLADHFNDDSYYGAAYTGHNLQRARNQYRLLELYLEKESSLSGRIPEN